MGEPTSWCMTVTANGRCVIAWTGSLLAPVHVGGVSRVCQPEYWGGGGGGAMEGLLSFIFIVSLSSGPSALIPVLSDSHLLSVKGSAKSRLAP